MDRVLKHDAERLLANVPEENVFRLHNGHIFKNMGELSQALSKMGNDDFTYHVNTEKNDFSKWVKDIIKDEKLAKDIAKSKNQSQTAKTVADRISSLNNRF